MNLLKSHPALNHDRVIETTSATHFEHLPINCILQLTIVHLLFLDFVKDNFLNYYFAKLSVTEQFVGIEINEPSISLVDSMRAINFPFNKFSAAVRFSSNVFPYVSRLSEM